MKDKVVLETSGLTKEFKTRSFFSVRRVTAVDGLDLEIREGEVFGFLGPNGAGKTTTLNMLVGLTEPTSGAIRLFGRRFAGGAIEPLRRMGYLPETSGLPEYLSVVELLDFYAQIFGLTAEAERAGRLKDLLTQVGLLQERRSLLKNLSMGQRRLVDLALALINDPDLILLDEPTVYLDPLMVECFRSIVLALKKRGKTVFVCSHTLTLIEKLCDRVAIIDHGRLLKVGSKEDFLRLGSMEDEFLRIIKDGKSFLA